MEVCPARAIRLVNDMPTFDYRKCIRLIFDSCPKVQFSNPL
jgi:Fe-S-cluster-containing hydrogenase component 2